MNYKLKIQQFYKLLFLLGLTHLSSSVIINPTEIDIINWFIGLGLTILYFISH